MRLTLIAAFLTLTACAAKPTVRPDPIAEPAKVTPKQPTRASDEGAQLTASLELEPRPIFYELDSAMLTEDSQRTLTELAEAMRRAPAATVKIAGHTCDLGTTEYNLALGLRRASEARDFLVRLGVGASRVEITTFGEEQPALSGNGEGDREKNRRSEFAVDGAKKRSEVRSAPGTRTASTR